jgi:hypothetical protein
VVVAYVINMKISFSAVTALLLIGDAAAFTTSPLHRTPTILKAAEYDVSIPYDAAARLAYEEWRETYNKGDFDDSNYEKFKDNYEVLTVANIAAAKKAKDAGVEEPKRMELNEFADMSFEEYESMNSGSDEGTTTTTTSASASILESAMEASAAQDAASASLEEAAAALAVEEEVRLFEIWKLYTI